MSTPDKPFQGSSNITPMNSTQTTASMTIGDSINAALTAIFLVLMAFFLLYSLYAMWPPPAAYTETKTGINLTVDNPTKPVIAGSIARYVLTVQNYDSVKDPVSFTVNGFPQSDKITFDPKETTVSPGPSKAIMTVDTTGIINGDNVYILLINAKRGTYTSTALVPFVVEQQKPRLPKPEETIAEKQAVTPPDSAGNKTLKEQDPRPVTYLYYKGPIYNETRLWLIVLICGALGATLHALRSFYWYVGNNELKLRWIPKYLLLPIAGGILGLGVYFIIRGGFIAPTTNAAETSSYSFAAVSFLLGLFSEQAVLKLLDVFNLIFAKPSPGKDAATQTTAPNGVPGGTMAPMPGGATLGPDFSLKMVPEAQSAKTDRSEVTYQLTLASLNGFNGAISLSADGPPPKADGKSSFRFDPESSITPTAAGTTVKFIVDPKELPAKAHPIKITAKSGAQSHEVNATLTVP